MEISMKNTIKVVGFLSSMLCAANVVAYNFTFENKTDEQVTVEVKIGLLGKSDTTTLPVGFADTFAYYGKDAKLCLQGVHCITQSGKEAFNVFVYGSHPFCGDAVFFIVYSPDGEVRIVKK
jgi:hypothetical protein